MKKSEISSRWTIENSSNLYQIDDWGAPYFSINADGHVVVSPRGNKDDSLDLFDLVKSLQEKDINLPLLIRFPEILADRLARLNNCFKNAIDHYNYSNHYQGVYPIKCHQNRRIIESIIRYGKPYQFGLESGSKPELMIALATLEPNSSVSDNSSIIVCNGYKDAIYIRTALLAVRLGYKLVIVIEQLEELYLTVQISEELAIEASLGIRVKLSTKGSGRWGNSTGDRAKFGLDIPQILTAIQYLKQKNILFYLEFLHFHIGSQISSISVIKDAMREASQIYVQLAKINPNMKYLDVGGGLGVDYEGSKTNSYASKNYNMQNYANDIVAEIKEACEEAGVAAPILISESGRAITAHHSVVIFNILHTNNVSSIVPPPREKEENLIVRNLWETYKSINPRNYQEMYHDAIQFKEEAISLFNFGYLSLMERAKAEQLYWVCCQKIYDMIQHQDCVPDDLEDLKKSMASIYYANLSVFRSAPDAWAINQLFPIMPVHRLNEKPTQRGTLADLTCDSDGKIDRFIDLRNSKSVLELHPLQPSKVNKDNNLFPLPFSNSEYSMKEPYYLGIFLVGAYQEIMGNFHNLFGNLNQVHIVINSKGYEIEHFVQGDTIADVLNYVQYDTNKLSQRIRQYTEQAVQEGRITQKESEILWRNYEENLGLYTYLV
ncbi:MAG: biosynthetic arginine decarboxylase [cyanobacterium endosymbiont of Rhopalodia musculus]|uniref:biosynthetic arginine decarboxylase n=1 Tax=cyanobacterium endosymbiont of Epithemia clementina EcSB TaxID=3034674 RepID=UPI00247FD108|nr:biosynthetic arginine decarboxylase [cyanobacterium endosymbiont of Epithemia clementina EcSB]WGT67116.1 biosynthetic arginine decarboxylase [cyanobacterium endosymbiont of Epithemia clementina EcSB]